MLNLNAKRGIKRKRGPHRSGENLLESIQGKFHHGVGEVKKVSKKVKIFEVQKIVKKLRDARSSNDENSIRLLELQLYCLKHLSHERIAFHALRSKIKKDTFLSRNEHFQAVLSAELKLEEERPEISNPQQAIVESRILSSKVLSQEITTMLGSLRGLLDGDQEASLVSKDPNTPHIISGETDGSENETGENAEEAKEDGLARGETPGCRAERKTKATMTSQLSDMDNESVVARSLEDTWAAFGGETGDANQPHGASKKEEKGVSGRWELAGIGEYEQEGEYDGWESGTVHSGSEQVAASEDDDSEELQSTMKQQLKFTRNKSESTKLGTSTFLPALSVGFVKGSSDSEWSSAEAGAADLPKRKNRRGQRARKAIWEKKYGWNANHLKRMREEAATVPSNTSKRTSHRGYSHSGRGRGMGQARRQSRGIDRSGAQGVSRSRGCENSHGSQLGPGLGQFNVRFERFRFQRSVGSSRRPQRDDMERSGGAVENCQITGNERTWPGASKPIRRMRDEKPLHPSWEAKRRLKEKQNAAIVPPQGTRLKFT